MLKDQVILLSKALIQTSYKELGQDDYGEDRGGICIYCGKWSWEESAIKHNKSCVTIKTKQFLKEIENEKDKR